MNQRESYPRAPVTEAIFEIQVELPLDVTIADLEQLSNAISTEYPQKRSRKRFEGKLGFNNQTLVSESIDLGIDGFLNWSLDEKQVVQFRLDGFSLSRLKPYHSWGEHFPEFIKNWILYSESFSPIRIKRIAVRFINVIDIPRESCLQEYFINTPKLPSKVFPLTNFFNRIEFCIPDKNVNTVVTQTFAKSLDPIKKSVILDIEAAQEINSKISEGSISNVFQVLRNVKNEAFKTSLMEKALELFK